MKFGAKKGPFQACSVGCLMRLQGTIHYCQGRIDRKERLDFFSQGRTILTTSAESSLGKISTLRRTVSFAPPWVQIERK